MSSASIKLTPTATPVTPEPTFQPPTNTPEAPASALITVEAESDTVARTGNWVAQDTSNASSGQYVYSSGSGDALTLGFSGSHLEVVFVKHPSFGSFAVEVDGALQQTVDAHADNSSFGNVVSVDNLAAGSHTVRVYAVQGTFALDAFHVEAVTAQATPTPTIAPTFQPPTNTPNSP